MERSSEIAQTLFARRMKIAREHMGISQVELGIRAGIDEYCASARINQYERGKHTPDFLTAQNLAKVLNVPTAYFYADDDTLAEIAVTFERLQLPDREALLNFAHSLANKNPSHSR